MVNITNEFTYSQSDPQLEYIDDIFEGSNAGPHENASPKNKPRENTGNHRNLTKRTSELHERAISSKKRSHCHLFLKRM